MPRKAKTLSALEVSRLTGPGNHAVGGVAGLYLYVNDAGARSWVLRMMVGDKRRHMGLGGFPDVSLAQAREKARVARTEVSDGRDPILDRRRLALELRSKQLLEKTFEEAATSYIAAHADSWTNPKHRGQWESTLRTYAYPILGSMHVRDITQEHILEVLEPIWKSKIETASRLQGRIANVLDWATVRKYREGKNPAQWKGHLDQLLPAPNKIKKVKHHRAVSVDELPKFVAELRERSGISARALEFAILTAARSGEVRGATWTEIDLKEKVWIVPAERMKAKREHRVPLSSGAVHVLNAMAPKPAGLIFQAPRGGPLSDMSLTEVMRRMKREEVPHGFRSTFRDWVGERTTYPREVAEQALAHTLQSKVEAAYRRGDALERRRPMMEDWDKFCASGRTAKSSQSLPDIMRNFIASKSPPTR